MFKGLFTALGDYRSSFQLMGELKLWKYFAVPMIISLLIFTAVFSIAWIVSDDLGRWIAGIWIWETGAETFQTVSTVIAGLVIVVLGFLIYKHLVMALSAPFMSPVSEKIEKHLYPHIVDDEHYRKTSNAEQLVRGLRMNMRNLTYELLITLPLLLLSLIPVVNFVTTPIIFLVQSYYAGFGNMDYTLERHYKYKSSVDFVKNNRGYAMGNGMLFIATALIPVVGVILVLPISVTAASRTTLRLINARIPAPVPKPIQ
ncbi:MAG: EI24 domain-containing protein [Nonlabens sp.]